MITMKALGTEGTHILFLFFLLLTSLILHLNELYRNMSKDSFHACFDDEKVAVFENTTNGIALFEKKLKHLHYKKKETTLGVEATGVYHLLLCLTVTRHNWLIKILNPLLVSQMIREGIRIVKNDRKDSKVIREAVRQGKGYPFVDTDETLALKALVSERSSLVTIKGSLKQRIHSHNIRKSSIALPIHDTYAPILLVLKKEIVVIEKHMKTLLPKTQSLLQTIPGIGPIASASLIAFIGDIRRFTHPDKLVAYVGIDPRVKQSGTSILGHGPISKRGNSLLRQILYQSAFVAKRRSLTFGRYYAKKKGEGKHHTSVLCAVERKLIHTIFAVWSKGEPFEERG